MNRKFLLVLCVFTLVELGLFAAVEKKPTAASGNKKKPPKPSNDTAISFDFFDFDPDFCRNNRDPDLDYQLFPHPDSCRKVIWCIGDDLVADECPDDLYFDAFEGFCGPRDEVRCIDDEYPEYPEYPDYFECPPAGNNDLVFIPSEFCDSYYICINGNPFPRRCPEGMHWNIDLEICDDPKTAGCLPGPEPIPDCPMGWVGQLPHPHNCNWFIHCGGNGSRTIQQCRHLFHFDIVLNRCVFKQQAQCIKDFDEERREGWNAPKGK